MRTCDCDPKTVCFYCDVTLSPRHEHDHWPIAARHDGADVVPACLNCHDLKDRVRLNHWDPELAAEAFAQCGPLGRLLVAKAAALIADLRQERAA